MINNSEKILLTKEGHKELILELKNLLDVVRPRVIEELKDARAQGDLSENSDYDSAKNKQAEVESRIRELEAILENAEIISNTNKKNTNVCIGSFVKLKYLDNNEIINFQIVSPIESNPLDKDMKISNESPLAKSILGKSVGETIEVLGVAKPYKVNIIEIKSTLKNK